MKQASEASRNNSYYSTKNKLESSKTPPMNDDIMNLEDNETFKKEETEDKIKANTIHEEHVT